MGCAYAAQSQARAFSLRKTCQYFESTWILLLGKNPTGSRGPSRGCRARVGCRPPLPAGESRGRRGWGAAGRPRLAAPGLGAAEPERGRECRQPPVAACGSSPGPSPAGTAGRGPEVPDTPRRLREPPASPLAWEPARPHLPSAGSESSKRGHGCRGQRGSRCSAGAVPEAKLTSSSPRLGAAPRPCPAQELLGVLCSPGSFPPSPCSHGNVPCKDFLPKDNPPEQKQTEKVVTNPFWMAVTRLLPAPAPPAICIQKNPENSRLPQHLAQTLRPRLAAGARVGGRCLRLR